MNKYKEEKDVDYRVSETYNDKIRTKINVDNALLGN